MDWDSLSHQFRNLSNRTCKLFNWGIKMCSSVWKNWNPVITTHSTVVKCSGKVLWHSCYYLHTWRGWVVSKASHPTLHIKLDGEVLLIADPPPANTITLHSSLVPQDRNLCIGGKYNLPGLTKPLLLMNQCNAMIQC